MKRTSHFLEQYLIVRCQQKKENQKGRVKGGAEVKKVAACHSDVSTLVQEQGWESLLAVVFADKFRMTL